MGVSSLLSSFSRYELFRLIPYLWTYANTCPFSIQLLRKIYIASQPSGSSPTISDYMQVFFKRMEVFVTIKKWLTVGGGAQDILDGVQLYSAVWSFLEYMTCSLMRMPGGQGLSLLHVHSLFSSFFSLSSFFLWLWLHFNPCIPGYTIASVEDCIAVK